MTRNEVFSLVQSIFVVTFKADESNITYTTNSDELKNWDSLNHIILISSIENELEIKFPLGELMELMSVGDIVDSCMKKL